MNCDLKVCSWLHFHSSHSCTGEGNGNPLQCSCLENPRDRGAWRAAVCGVAQSRTRLKRLSSSSSSSKMSQSWQVCGWARFHQNPKMACNLGELETGIYRLWKCLGRSSDTWKIWQLFCIPHLKVNLGNYTTWKLFPTYPLVLLHKKLYMSKCRTELVKKWG